MILTSFSSKDRQGLGLDTIGAIVAIVGGIVGAAAATLMLTDLNLSSLTIERDKKEAEQD